MDERELEKQRQEISEWLQIRAEKGEEFMRGTVVEGDLEPYRDTVIVDVGCGPRPFVEHFPASLAVMLDCCMRGYRQENLLQDSTLDKVLCAEGMGEDLPFKDQSVDHVFAINMLDHTFAPEKVVDEFHRILRPGGMVHLNVDIGGEPNACEPVVFERADIDRLFSRFHLVYQEDRDASNPGREAMLVRIFARSEGYVADAPKPEPPTGFAEILACPQCRGNLDESDAAYTCRACERDYAIENRIPVLVL